MSDRLDCIPDPATIIQRLSETLEERRLVRRALSIAYARADLAARRRRQSAVPIPAPAPVATGGART